MNTPEATWKARVDELRDVLPTMSRTDAVVAVAELVALLDAHSGLYPEEHGFDYYALKVYEFSDGVHVVAADDPTLYGARLDAIGSTPIADVLERITPLINRDNDSSLRLVRSWYVSTAEYLQSKGIVEDLDHPGFRLTRPDGTEVVIDPRRAPLEEAFAGMPILGSIGGDSLEYVRQGIENEIWWRIEPKERTFILGYSNIGAPTAEALSAMKAALDTGTVDRVIFDMRLSGGGNYQLAVPIIDAFRTQPRINRPGGLAVLISRENASASNALAETLAETTEATLIGEPTPARRNTIGGDEVVTLRHSGIRVHLPVYRITTVSGEAAEAVLPDVPVDLTAADYFAGIDRVLDAALALDGPAG
jgi:hypothetical protein